MKFNLFTTSMTIKSSPYHLQRTEKCFAKFTFSLSIIRAFDWLKARTTRTVICISNKDKPQNNNQITNAKTNVYKQLKTLHHNQEQQQTGLQPPTTITQPLIDQITIITETSTIKTITTTKTRKTKLNNINIIVDSIKKKLPRNDIISNITKKTTICSHQNGNDRNFQWKRTIPIVGNSKIENNQKQDTFG